MEENQERTVTELRKDKISRKRVWADSVNGGLEEKEDGASARKRSLKTSARAVSVESLSLNCTEV